MKAKKAPFDQSMPSGNDASLHQGPVVGDLAGVEASDPGSEQKLHEQDRQRHDGRGRQARRAVLTSPCKPAKIERHPDEGAHDRKSQQQVRRQAEVADVGAIDEAAHHHVPAEHALHSTEHEEADELPAIALRDRAPTANQISGRANATPIRRPIKR